MILYLISDYIFQCESVDNHKKYFMPLQSKYLLQVGEAMGINEY